jgi:iron complex transport system ATP-binding protein
LLQATDLTFGYQEKPVIDGLSLEVGRGALIGVLGPNGSGKTTLLRLLAGTLKPTRGSIQLDGRNLADTPRSTVARRCASVPQETHLAFEYTALEIVLMGRYPHLGAFEVEGPDDLASALRALEATGTADLAERQFHTLSGGEKQRVIIASALAQLDSGLAWGPASAGRGAGPPEGGHHDPEKLLFLDEPTASLDLKYQIEVAQLITRLHAAGDISIVVSTHDLHFAASVCNQVLLLKNGRALARGSTSDVLVPSRVAELYDVEASALHPW